MAQHLWLPDESQHTCTSCNSKFDLMNRKHHCRACGRIFCGACSNNKMELPHMGTKGKQRGKIINTSNNKNSNRLTLVFFFPFSLFFCSILFILAQLFFFCL